MKILKRKKVIMNLGTALVCVVGFIHPTVASADRYIGLAGDCIVYHSGMWTTSYGIWNRSTVYCPKKHKRVVHTSYISAQGGKGVQKHSSKDNSNGSVLTVKIPCWPGNKQWTYTAKSRINTLPYSGSVSAFTGGIGGHIKRAYCTPA